LRTKDFSGVPAAARALRLTVTVPARNEQAAIERCLRAFAMQRTTCGRPLAAEVLDVVVYANSCGDGTAHVAARFVAAHPQLRAWVVASPLPSGDAHVGTARKTGRDFAASRFLRARSPRGLVASVDADTIVDPDWAARLLAAAERVDAVAGHVFIDALELATLPAGVRRLYALEATYRRLCAELEATIDPLLEDPAPRHDAFVGANFAVTAGTYVAAGGIPPLPRLEDRAFLFALRRIDARVRFSLDVRAATSGRRTPRVAGGFGTERRELYLRGLRRETFFVDHPGRLEEATCARAALRRIWSGAGYSSDVALTCRSFKVSERDVRSFVRTSLPFGRMYERLAKHAALARRYEKVPVEAAIEELRTAILRRTADVAIRTFAASGAG